MHTIARTPTTDMEVTSIRLERELKDKLKTIAGNQGYQALIRDILWNYVQQKSGEWKPRFSQTDIRVTIEATSQQEEQCVLTGQLIQPQQPMLLGLTRNGEIVPLGRESLNPLNLVEF
jgi:predicted DNA-binding ribbon-helix-helix protein